MERMDSDIQKIFADLFAVCGSNTKAAKQMGISKTHYCDLVKGKCPITNRMREYIFFKSQQILKNPQL